MKRKTVRRYRDMVRATVLVDKPVRVRWDGKDVSLSGPKDEQIAAAVPAFQPAEPRQDVSFLATRVNAPCRVHVRDGKLIECLAGDVIARFPNGLEVLPAKLWDGFFGFPAATEVQGVGFKTDGIPVELVDGTHMPPTEIEPGETDNAVVTLATGLTGEAQAAEIEAAVDAANAETIARAIDAGVLDNEAPATNSADVAGDVEASSAAASPSGEGRVTPPAPQSKTKAKAAETPKKRKGR